MKLVDPRGEMLEASWEGHATTLANAATTEDFIAVLETIIRTTKIDLSKPARVVYARDTRPSGPALVASLEDGFQAMGAEARNGGVTTTPVLHYYVRAMNTKGTKDAYGEDTEEGYFTKLSTAFAKLVVSLRFPLHLERDARLMANHTVRQTRAPTAHGRLCQRRRRGRYCQDLAILRRPSQACTRQHCYDNAWRTQQCVWRRLRQDIPEASSFFGWPTQARTTGLQFGR